MSFKVNSNQQISFNDSVFSLTAREKKYLIIHGRKYLRMRFFPILMNYPNKIPDDLKHYTDSNDYNRIFYHQLNDNMEQIIQALLSDSDKLLELCGTDYEEVTEYQLFLRCLSDQTVVENGKRRLRTKEDGTMNSTALQNPSDPDATYRNKADKLHRGYVANLEETVDKNGSVVTDYQYDKNIHTDSQNVRV